VSVLPPLAEILDGSALAVGSCRSGAYPKVDWYPPPQKPAAAAVAVAVCQRCPVQTECLLFALHRGEIDGIWGGLSAKKRARLRTMLDRLGLALPLHRCAYCGGEFRVSVLTSNERYCSDAHRSAARRRRELAASR
jgi:hypothetical protein